jgi:hypothetical protein
MQLFLTVFESVPDSRAENVRHDLVEILLIAFPAVLCGAQHCSEMAEFGRAKLKFLKRFLKSNSGTAFPRTTRSSPRSACSIRKRSMPRSGG